MDATLSTEVSTETASPLGTAESSAGDAPVVETEATQETAPTPEEQSTEQAEAAFKVPENDDDLKDQENNPHVQSIIQMRKELRERDQRLDQFKDWQDVVGSTDPTTVKSDRELLSLLYSPTQNGDPNDYSTTPFLQRLEQDSPGAVDKLYRDLTTFPVEMNGVTDTLARQMVRSWGLNPDNLQRYRELENGTLSVASGIVSTEDLAKIPQAYHEGFKSLPPQAQKDILSLNGSEHEADRLTAQAYLQSAQQAAESQKFRDEVQRHQESERQRQEAETQQKIETQSHAALDQLTSEVYDSIRTNLAQVKVSANELENELHVGSQMALLYAAIDPVGRKMILDPLLSKLGVSLDSTIAGVQVPFADTINTIEQKTAEAVKWDVYGDKRQAAAARAAATQSRHVLTAKLNQIASKLASPAKVNGNGNGAIARTVPSGNAMQQQTGKNPYDDNPHPFGTQEYISWNRNLDRQLGARAF